MRLCFIVADARAQRPTWGSVYLARAAMRRGHTIAFASVDDLTLRADNSVIGRVRHVANETIDNEALCRALADAEPVEELLTSNDVVVLRYHPRREGGGQRTPAIDFGWRLRLGGALVVNDPEGTQRAGGRMWLAGLPAEIRPRMLVTREPARAKAFLKELGAAAVAKPLAERHAGVDSVFYLARGQVKNRNQILQVVRKTGYILVQEYLPDIVHGEKRLLLLGGEPIRKGERVAIYRRAPPGDGSATPGPLPAAGHESTRKPCDFGPAEQRIVDLLRPRLEAEGLYFVGVDIVGDKVLDLNVYTPGGLHANQALYGIDVGEAVVRDLERRVEVRHAYRKSLEPGIEP